MSQENPSFFTGIKVIAYVFLLIIAVFNTVWAQDIKQPTDTSCSPVIQKIDTFKSAQEKHARREVLQTHRITLPHQWSVKPTNQAYTFWYKIDFKYSCLDVKHAAPVHFAIDGFTQSGRIFLNQQVLWQDDFLKTDMARNQHLPRMWSIPAAHLQEGLNSILIQVYPNIMGQVGIGAISLSNNPDTAATYQTWFFEKRTLVKFNLVVNSVVGIFYFLAWLVYRSEKAFLMFSVTALLWSLYSFFFLSTHPNFFSSISTEHLQHIIFCFYTVSGCLAAWLFAGVRFPYVQRCLIIFLGISTLTLITTPQQYLYSISNLIFSIAVLLGLIKCLTYPIIAYRAKNPEVYLLMLILLIYVPLMINDAYFMMTNQGTPLSPYAGPFITLVFGSLLAMRLARNKRQIEAFNQTLKERIQQTKHELTLSLQQQHDLSIENMRLQERIHLSQELHDGLGSSIVRSIMLVENNRQLSNPQILSLLKMLRSDLRQMIDMGSSLSATPPKTPREWIAPLRYRFVRIFEELNIESVWQCNEQWIDQPTPLITITLSRVAEEALTNILKHSQASYVNVLLKENENFILEIHDNGKGFDPQQVEKELHVGLQSMQSRVEKMKGTLTIQSQPQSTLICIMLPKT